MCLLAHKWLTSQQARIRPPNTVIQSRPSNSKQGSAHQPLSFRAGPIRMGRAKNLPVGGKSAGVHNLCLLACAPVGGDPSPCGAQDDSVRGMLNLFVGVPACGGDPPCRWQARANRLRASG